MITCNSRRRETGARAEAEHQGDAYAGGKDHSRLAQRIKPAIAGQNGGDCVRRSDVPGRSFQVGATDIGVRRRRRIAQSW